MNNPLDNIVPDAIGPFVACLARPDGTTDVVSGDTAMQTLVKLLYACLAKTAGRADE